jgi:hypothetical protein
VGRATTISRVAVACAAIAAGFALGYFPRAVSRLGDAASENSRLSFADREIAGGNSIVVDQEAAFEARLLIPRQATYRVVAGPHLQGATPLTRPFVEGWFRYFLMPRRPARDASWIVCYGCDEAELGEAFHRRWRDLSGISIGRLR